MAFGLCGLPAIGVSDAVRRCQLDDWRTGNFVLGVLVVVDVEFYAGFTELDVAWDGNSGLRDEVAAAFEEDLGTACVKLAVPIRGVVECEDFRTSKVISALESFGKLYREPTFVGDELVGTPFVLGGIVAVVKELEPAVARSYSVLVYTGKYMDFGEVPLSSMAELTFFRYTAHGP